MASLQHFEEMRFRQRVDAALDQARNILSIARAPAPAADVGHKYDDKYALAEWMGNLTVATLLQCMEQMGASPADLATMSNWARGGRSVSLRFECTETCVYVREHKREVESPKVVTEHSLFGKCSTKVVTTILDQIWRFEATWQLLAFVGTGSAAGETLPLLMRKGACDITVPDGDKTVSPRLAKTISGPWDVNVTWLFQQVDTAMAPSWTIQRGLASCRTPRRNDQVEAAFTFFRSWFTWTQRVSRYFTQSLAPIRQGHGLDMSAVTSSGIFVPVVPLFEAGNQGPPTAQHLKAPPELKAPKLLMPGDAEEEAKQDEPAAVGAQSASVVPAGAPAPAASGSALLPLSDTPLLLAEHKRTLEAKRAALARVFPTREQGELMSQVEAGLAVVLQHASSLAQAWADGIESIEGMLRRQLVAAIGREVTPLDFANYMRFHHHKIYRPAYEPRMFSHAVRRPEHVPEGTLSIEATTPGQAAGQNAEPIVTICRQMGHSWPMRFALNAATNVTFRGERYLHAYMSQQFSGQGMPSLTLQARARQFSSFVVLLGSLSGADLFQPKHAILVQNKDELSIPLNLETMPSAAEFRDAIESLSPEQQRFCKAYRSMQLEGSLFGILVLQVKPALEKLLNLPRDALTKEIELTQDVLDLFQTYSIPSDMLTYEADKAGANDAAPATTAEKLAFVRAQVAKMKAMIASEKARELEEQKQEAMFAVAQRVAEDMSDLDSCEEELSMPVPERRMESQSFGGAPRGGGGIMSMIRGRAPGAALSRAPAPPMMCSAPSAPTLSSSSLAANSAPMMKRKSAAAAPPPPAREMSHQMQQQPKPQAQPAPAPVAQKQEQAVKQDQAPQPRDADDVSPVDASVSEPDAPLDWTAIPAALDAKLLSLDEDAALRPTTITAGSAWSRRAQKSLLSKPVTASLDAEQQDRAKVQAFELLDALSRSGSLDLDEGAELHVVLAFTHLFDRSLIDTVVQGNVNPIEKVERSALLIATTVHDKQPSELIKPDQRERIATYSRKIFIEEQKYTREQLALQA